MTTIPAITPLNDVSAWARSDGLEVVLLVVGAMLLVRFVGWFRDRVAGRIEATTDEEALVRSEASKHRHALAQILSWVVIA